MSRDVTPEELLDFWKEAIDDDNFQATLRGTLSPADLAHTYANQSILVNLHRVSRAAYEKGKAAGIEGVRGAGMVGAAPEMRAELLRRNGHVKRPLLRSLEADESAYLATCPPDDQAVTVRNHEVALHAAQVSFWESTHPEDTITPEQTTVDLLSLVMDGDPITVEQVRTWTHMQILHAEAWAGACHLSASDNDDIEVPERPLHTFPPTGLWCVECGLPQYKSPGGPVCSNGHGGVEGLTFEDITRRKGADT